MFPFIWAQYSAIRALSSILRKGWRTARSTLLVCMPGNHGNFFDYPTWMRHLTGTGYGCFQMPMPLSLARDARVVIAGVTDLSAPQVSQAGPDLNAAFAGAPPGAPLFCSTTTRRTLGKPQHGA